MTTREATLDFVANPRGKSQLYEGPVAILVDGMSVSTSELFAAGFQETGRARVFGQTSAGMALPSIIETLPNGDRLQFAVADLTGPSGRRIEGAGVIPDVVTIPTREQLLAGRDPALEAALAWIAAQDGSPPR
jgi:carboxyl-terminal processing protease